MSSAVLSPLAPTVESPPAINDNPLNACLSPKQIAGICNDKFFWQDQYQSLNPIEKGQLLARLLAQPNEGLQGVAYTLFNQHEYNSWASILHELQLQGPDGAAYASRLVRNFVDTFEEQTDWKVRQVIRQMTEDNSSELRTLAVEALLHIKDLELFSSALVDASWTEVDRYNREFRPEALVKEVFVQSDSLNYRAAALLAGRSSPQVRAMIEAPSPLIPLEQFPLLLSAVLKPIEPKPAETSVGPDIPW